MNTRPSTLEITGLSLNFGGLKVLEDVSLSVGHGEVLGLIGPNGAGKSALLNCISALYQPQVGSSIRFEGKELVGSPAPTIARLGIKRTFQHIHLLESLTVLENVLIGLTSHYRGGLLRRYGLFFSSAAEERRMRNLAMETLELCEIADRASEPAMGLPLGVRRRVDLARALASGPRLFLLDEPASGLATEERQLVRELISIAQQKGEIAVIWIEHDLELVISSASRVIVLHHGRVVSEGDPRRSPQERQSLIDAYLTGDRPAPA